LQRGHQRSDPGPPADVGLVRAEAEAMGMRWICERELREGIGGRPLHLPDGVVIDRDQSGKEWRIAIEWSSPARQKSGSPPSCASS
jgi:hypothetical protein